MGLKLTVDDFEKLGSEVPCLLNLQPSGEHLMEDFCYAGGLPVVMKEIQHLLHLGASSPSAANGGREHCRRPELRPPRDQDPTQPFKEKAGIAVLRGNLAPRGAVIKPCGHARADGAHRPCRGVRGQPRLSTSALTTTTWTWTKPASWC
jgi:L-arabonate dehydrase